MINTWNKMKIAKTIHVRNSDIAIYLIDSDECPDSVFDNIIAVSGSVVIWKLHPRGVPDFFVDMDYNGTVLTAYSFSGQKLVVDPIKGSLINIEFTK